MVSSQARKTTSKTKPIHGKIQVVSHSIIFRPFAWSLTASISRELNLLFGSSHQATLTLSFYCRVAKLSEPNRLPSRGSRSFESMVPRYTAPRSYTHRRDAHAQPSAVAAHECYSLPEPSPSSSPMLSRRAEHLHRYDCLMSAL